MWDCMDGRYVCEDGFIHSEILILLLQWTILICPVVLSIWTLKLFVENTSNTSKDNIARRQHISGPHYW